jgi:hypothetical protein
MKCLVLLISLDNVSLINNVVATNLILNMYFLFVWPEWPCRTIDKSVKHWLNDPEIFERPEFRVFFCVVSPFFET